MPKLTPTLLRRLTQTAFALVCISIGLRFYAFLQWTAGNGPEAARPASVEAFLPISALMAAKRLALTGKWDPFHPAGLALFLCFVLMAWLLRKGFCSHVCPVGLLSNLLESAGKRLGLLRRVPQRLDTALCAVKYLLLGFFAFSVLTMPLRGLERFLRSPYNLTADARMLEFFTRPGMTAIFVLAGLAVLSLVVRNIWCRYLCPYGALLGIASLCSPLAISREKESCINCGKCSRACPSAIKVENKETVLTPECTGCAACVEACPVEGCLSLRAGNRRLPLRTVPLGCVILVAACFAIASATGHWDNALPPDMARMLYGAP